MTVTVVSVGWWYCNVRTVVFEFSSRKEEGAPRKFPLVLSGCLASCLSLLAAQALFIRLPARGQTGTRARGYMGTWVHGHTGKRYTVHSKPIWHCNPAAISSLCDGTCTVTHSRGPF